MMAKQHPFVRRIVVVAVPETVGRRFTGVIERGHLGGQKRAVVSISDGQHAQRAQKQRHGVPDQLAALLLIENVGKRHYRNSISTQIVCDWRIDAYFLGFFRFGEADFFWRRRYSSIFLGDTWRSNSSGGTPSNRSSYVRSLRCSFA